MKTAPLNLKETFFKHFKQQSQCEKLSIGALRSYLLEPLQPVVSWVGVLRKKAASQLTNLLALLVSRSSTVASLTEKLNGENQTGLISWITVHVFKGLFVGLSALRKTSGVNRRMYVGLVMMFFVAPVFYCLYLFFGRSGGVGEWFHYNFFHLFFLIRWQMFLVFFLLGLYQYLEQDRRVKILAPFLGYVFMSLILAVLAKSNDDIWDVGNLILFTSCTLISLVIFRGLDYFVWRKYHREDAFEARIDHILNNAHLIGSDAAVSMLQATRKEQKQFKTKG